MTATESPKRAGVVIKSVVTLAAVPLAAYLVWGLRGFIVPAFAGGLLAYICRPVIARLERGRIPRGLAVGLLLLTFGAVTLVGLNSVRAAIPSEIEALELRVRALYALNQEYGQSLAFGMDREARFNGANTLVIAGSVSNGVAAVLRFSDDLARGDELACRRRHVLERHRTGRYRGM